MGTITLKKGVYIIGVNYIFTASTVGGVRGCYLANNKGWNGPYILELVNATTESNRTQRLLNAVIEVLEDTIVTVKSIQSSGINLTSDVFVSIVILA